MSIKFIEENYTDSSVWLRCNCGCCIVLVEKSDNTYELEKDGTLFGKSGVNIIAKDDPEYYVNLIDALGGEGTSPKHRGVITRIKCAWKALFGKRYYYHEAILTKDKYDKWVDALVELKEKKGN